MATFLDDPVQSGLLNFGLAMMAGSGPSPYKQSLASIAGKAGLAGTKAYKDQQEFIDEMEMRKIRRKLFESQIAETLAQAKEREQKMSEATRVRDMLSEAVSPVSASQALSVPGLPSGPTTERAEMIGQRKPIDFRSLIAAGVPAEIVKAIAEAPNLGRPKVARTIEVDDGQGGKKIVQADEFGNPVGSGFSGYVPPVQVNQGNQISFVKPAPGTTLPVGMSPSERDASARGWGGLRLQQSEAARPKWVPGVGFVSFDSNNQPTISNPPGVQTKDAPAGYKWSSDGKSMEKIPGGPADKETMTEGQAKANMFGNRMLQAEKELADPRLKGVTPSLIKRGAEAIPFIGPGLGMAANQMFTNEGQQRVEQAQRNFINAILRRESGATIIDDEFMNAYRQYFPQPGDSAGNIAQKTRNRVLATEAMKREAGPAWREISIDPNMGLEIPSWGDAQERRLQELEAKKRAGTLR